MCAVQCPSFIVYFDLLYDMFWIKLQKQWLRSVPFLQPTVIPQCVDTSNNLLTIGFDKNISRVYELMLIYIKTIGLHILKIKAYRTIILPVVCMGVKLGR